MADITDQVILGQYL